MPQTETKPEVLHLSENDFSSEVLQSDKPVLVDFWAPWCGPCRMIAPVLDELAGEYAGRAKIAKVNVDDNPTLASKLSIRSIPTLMVFHHGQVAQHTVGAQPKHALVSLLEQTLQAAA